MRSESILKPTADDFEMPPGCEADDGDDLAFTSMLTLAYDVPTVPRSLTKRLDAGITQQWGQSPNLARAAFVTVGANAVDSIERTRKFAARWCWVVGATAAAAVFGLVMLGGSGQYAWASVVAAMRQHGIVSIVYGDATRWLDLANEIACEQTPHHTDWIDLRRGVALTYHDAKDPPQQTSLRRSDGSLPQRDALLAVFLLGHPLSPQSLERFHDVRVLDQRVSPASDSSTPNVNLKLRLATSQDERFEISLQLDPKTKLPQSVETLDQTTNIQTSSPAPVANMGRELRYWSESINPLRGRLVYDPLGVSTATGETDSRGDSPGAIMKATDSNSAQSTDPTATTPSIAQSLVSSLPTGAPIQWQPVAVVSRTGTEVQQRVDRILSDLWQHQQIEPADEATDLQLLRRVYLDLAGRTPTVSEVRAYASDTSADRYVRLVDRVLASPDHASQMAAVWRSFLIPEGVDLTAFGGREAFEKWLTERFASNIPYDKIVRELLLAEGRLSQSGPLLFYSALKLDPDHLAARTSRVFLGMRLECAQCHDHPFEPWKQEDFWSYAAFFAQISRPKGMLETASTIMRVQDIDRGEVMLPDTEHVVKPRFLGESSAQQNESETENDVSRRQRLARWLTGAKNPYFARATANRVWSHLFGRGIVDPVDDFGTKNIPVSPELLDTLAGHFIDGGFDLRKLIRTIVLSRAYRLSSSSNRDGESDAVVQQRLTAFAQMNVKTLTAEQLFDCIAVATLFNTQSATASQYSLSRFGNSERDEFLQQFASPTTSRAEYLAGIPQALMLMNGSMIARATGESTSGLIQSLEAPFFTDRQRIDVLFMATLSRPARSDEWKLMEEFLPTGISSPQRRAALADLLWALVNSSEFTLNH